MNLDTYVETATRPRHQILAVEIETTVNSKKDQITQAKSHSSRVKGQVDKMQVAKWTSSYKAKVADDGILTNIEQSHQQCTRLTVAPGLVVKRRWSESHIRRSEPHENKETELRQI